MIFARCNLARSSQDDVRPLVAGKEVEEMDCKEVEKEKGGREDGGRKGEWVEVGKGEGKGDETEMGVNSEMTEHCKAALIALFSSS